MKLSLRLLIVSAFVIAAPLLGSRLNAQDLPEEVERQIEEQTEGLPDEIKEKIKEAASKKLAELKDKVKEAKEEADDADKKDADEDKDAEKKDKGDDDKDKKADKPKKPTPSDEVKKLKAERDLYEARFKQKVHEYKKTLEAQLLLLEKSKIDRKIEADRAAALKETASRERDRLKMELDLAKLRRTADKARFDAEIAELDREKKRVETRIAVETSKEKLENRVLGEEQYPDEPFKDGVLSISTRRIELNGPIMTGAADYICQRIDYYNNQSDKPIFIIIDDSPGGSVLEGFHILQGMKESKAPIHVVVKRFAASMAACITTLADHSYCYPNAIILHHQASTVLYGNGRDMEDQRKQFDEISDRLLGQVADKMGISLEDFVKQMYENRVSGDWDLFGDQAIEKKWVDHVATGVLEESIRKRPTGMMPQPFFFFFSQTDNAPGAAAKAPTSSNYLERYQATLHEQVDAKGQRYVQLPRLSPIDAWLMYNPDSYYRY